MGNGVSSGGAYGKDRFKKQLYFYGNSILFGIGGGSRL